jgi:hypothetical protein
MSEPTRPKRSRDPNVLAWQVVQEATGEAASPKGRAKNPAAVELGRMGGRKGGRARTQAMTPEQRRELAQHAARERWKKPRAR